MTRRRGITLLETLAAIFIVGIGLLSLLTLFPAGAIKMAEAVKDDRTGHIKENAHSIADVLGVRGNTVHRVTGAQLSDDPAQNNDPVIEKLLRPGAPLQDLFDPRTQAYIDSPSYAVLVDPNGYNANAPNPTDWQPWVAGTAGYLPRTVPAPLHPSATVNPDRSFTSGTPALRTQRRIGATVFLDDMRFQRESDNDSGPNGPVYTGWPTAVPDGRVDRTPRWSWAWLVQRPKAANSRVVELTVVVYNGRDLTTPRTGEQIFGNAPNPPCTFNANGTVTITWGAGQTPPELKTGGWILDVRPAPSPRAKFHRVTNITQTGATSMEVEIQGAVRSGAGAVFILENVVEVFERGTF